MIIQHAGHVYRLDTEWDLRRFCWCLAAGGPLAAWRWRIA